MCVKIIVGNKGRYCFGERNKQGAGASAGLASTGLNRINRPCNISSSHLVQISGAVIRTPSCLVEQSVGLQCLSGFSLLPVHYHLFGELWAVGGSIYSLTAACSLEAGRRTTMN